MTEVTAGHEEPHVDRPVETAGRDLRRADAVAILLHGRGATPQSVLGIAREVDVEGVAYLAPAATRGSWYPRSFMEPIQANEPALSAALTLVDDLVDRGVESVGRDRVVLLGFSQGACLASEYVARNATRYGGLAALSGGLVGPEGTPREYDGSLAGTPVFVGCSDVDPHIPLARVEETSEVLSTLDGAVTERIYEGMGHTINRDEIDHVERLLADAVE